MSNRFEQVVSLVTYGNVYLQNKSAEIDIENFITKYCHGLDFIDRPIEGIAGSTKVIASDACKWFDYLKGQNAKRIKLHYRSSSQTELPDHISSAFVGGGSQWFVEVQYEDKSHLYLSGWVPSEGSVSHKTHYVLLERNLSHLDDLAPSVSESRAQLGKVLEDLSAFAERFDYTQNWVDNFNNSLKTLKEFDPKSDDFIPSSIYSKEARQLIETAFRSSGIFGGMGSWNDLAFNGEDQEGYTSLSEELYSTICQAIVSGVNSYP